MSSAQSDNRKPFWRYLKSRRQDNVGIGTLKTMHGVAIADSKDKAELLNEYFYSVFTTEDLGLVPDMDPSHESVPVIDITTHGVYNLSN